MPAANLKERARQLGFEGVGVCAPVPAPHIAAYERWLDKGRHGRMAYLERHLPLKESPLSLLPEARSVIAVALHYGQSYVAQPGFPKIARYALGRDYHKVLRGKLRQLSQWIEKEHPGATCRSCVDSAPIFERDYANLAGLGWFGKNTCLIDSKRGSWFFIGLLLTSIAFQFDSPSVGSCGKCAKCIEACPTGAIVFDDGRWQVDARNCISYLTIEHRGTFSKEQSKMIGDWTFGCDVCQEVCPFNSVRAAQPMRAPLTRENDFLRAQDWPDLKQLAQISRDEWDVLTRGSAVRRAGYDGLRRNARVNLQASSGSRQA